MISARTIFNVAGIIVAVTFVAALVAVVVSGSDEKVSYVKVRMVTE